MKLFWINLKHYSETCSNNHLSKTTTHLKRPMLSAESAQANSCTIVIVYDYHLSNATSDYFFITQMKKT